MISFPKVYKLILLISIFSLNSFAIFPGYAETKQTVIIVPYKKKSMDKWVQSMKEVELQAEYEKKAKKEYEKGNFEQALKLAQKSFEYSPNPNNANSWGGHKIRADIYEATVRKEEFIKEIDWLIKWCRNDKTKQRLLQRKQRFIESHSNQNSK